MASSITSGLKSADAVIATGRNRINAVTLIADGTNAANVVVYDNASAASGTVLAKVTAVAGQGTVHVIFENPVTANDGIYADVTGTGAGYIVYYGG
jgi:hypothetical protein